MTLPAIDQCPGCGVALPAIDGPTHRYIEASPACWAMYTAMGAGGDPPIAHTPVEALLVDAYAVQHPGQPSPQAIQSVAVHLLTLYGVLVAGVDPAHAIGLRRRVLDERHGSRRGRFQWLVPPSFAATLTVADVVGGPTPLARAALLEQYVRGVWAVWDGAYGERVQAWYRAFVIAD